MKTNDHDVERNKTYNRAHYNDHYKTVTNIDDIIHKINGYEQFLEVATRLDTSWVAMYGRNLRALINKAHVLEIGCGDGLNAGIMDKLGARVVATDLSDESERIIARINETTNTSIEYVTPERLYAESKYHSAFDVVIGKAVIHHLTHDEEEELLRATSLWLNSGGEARYFEPAENSILLDWLRWLVPVPGRPSRLCRTRFAAWKAADPHPERDNSTRHYLDVCRRYFHHVHIYPIGGLERFCRLMPLGRLRDSYRVAAYKCEKYIPSAFASMIARSQLIVCREPRRDCETISK